jgi:hypothetical protein
MWIFLKGSLRKRFPAQSQVQKSHKILLLYLFLLVAISLAACAPLTGGPLQTETRVVELEGVETTQVEIRMGAGRLRVEGGSRALLEGAFTYNIEEWRPEVNYSINGDIGNLVIQQPAGIDIIPQVGTSQYDWNLSLNSQVPMDLNVILGAGEGVLHLSDLNLTNLAITTGAGTTIVDLRKNWPNDLNAEITGGLGEVKLQLPSRTGVRLETTGLAIVNAGDLIRDGNTYTNQAYEQTGTNLYVSFWAGIGALNVEVNQ